MKFSYIKIDITPSKSYPLAGFKERLKNQDTFGSGRLYFAVLRLHSENEDTFWVSMDTLYFPERLIVEIRQELGDLFQAKEDQIIFNASHTHSAPNLIGSPFGNFNEDYYSDLRIKIFRDLHLLSNLKEGQIKFWESFIPKGLITNRRRLLGRFLRIILRRNVVLQPNNKDFRDYPIFHFEIIDDKSQKLHIYSFSCHPTFAKNDKVSADFPGSISELIEKDNLTEAIFLQGFCGDVRPNIISNNFLGLNFKNFLKKLLFRKIFRDSMPNDMKNFSMSIYDSIKASCMERNKIDINRVRTFQRTFCLYDINEKYKKTFSVEFTILNKSIVLLSIPAEVLYGFYEFLIENLTTTSIVPLGYGSGMIGYLPLEEDIRLGGYEISSAVNYGWPESISQTSLTNFKEQLLSEIKAEIE